MTKSILLWKWILLYFCPTRIGFDVKDDICCVCFVKVLFNKIYIMREDLFCISTGNLLSTTKLIRRNKK